MEMEMEVAGAEGLELRASDTLVERLAERLMGAADALEQAAERLAGMGIAASTAGLEQRLAEAEATIAALKAGGRKTSHVGSLVAKEGSFDGGAANGASIDSALGSLSVEQRIAVKAGLMRAGLLG